MYVLLTKKTSLQAKNQMKPLQQTDGLEAWRPLKINPKQERRTKELGGVLTALPKLESSDMLGLTNQLVRLEAELARFEGIDGRYALRQIKRGNIIYRARPDKIQKDADKDVAKR